jgi:DNA-binding winged helix-turn-helix (wHTH) protein
MQYRWDDFSLDREGALLTRQRQQVDISRKVLDCISHLLEHRQRVVSYDELIREVWGHDNVTNNQLSQVILAARRALGDDGHAQRLIRTMPGLGYRWVGALCETAAADTAPQAQVPEWSMPMLVDAAASMPDTSRPAQTDPVVPISAPISAPRMVAAPWYRNRPLRIAAAAALVLATVAVVGWQWRKVEPATVATHLSIAAATLTATATAVGPLARLEEAFWRGKYEEVRAGLAALPADLADSPDARLLDIRLDIERGRFDRAAKKLALQQARAKTADDPVWQAKLFARQSFLSGSAGKAAPDILAPAQLAVELLESALQAAPPQAMGEALSARGYGLMKANQLEPAVRDLVRARALLLKAGDTHGAANAADTLARVQSVWVAWQMRWR